MNNEIRIVIADDHPIFRRGLRMVIEADSLLRIVAEADNGESALAQIDELRPDVVVLDINMPPPDGLAVAHELRRRQLPLEIIFLTMHKDEALLNTAIDLGVKGFIVKDAAVNEIVGCIKAVAAGQGYFSSVLTDHLITPRKQSPLASLTATELRVLSLVGEAKTNKQIAAELFVSIRTVEHHRSNICAKLGLAGKNALLTFALTHKDKLGR
ncbi:MAG TPA: response regulator transcription factor [Pyrinomonadaceae bacterium]